MGDVAPKAGKDAAKVSALIMGEEYVIRGDADSDYIEGIARNVDARMRRIAESNQRLSLQQAAVLAALNIADELESSKRRAADLLRLLEQI